MQRRVLSGKGSSLIVGADLEISKCFKKKIPCCLWQGIL
tara:strand:+ start:224 stop:340 length:117 start_codon:yes stop_codon:yes gene_type:complete